MKKILSIIAAAVIGLTAVGTAVFADTPEKEGEDSLPQSTLCFDTEKVLEYVHTFGAAEQAGLEYKIDTENAAKNGSLAISENFAGELTENSGNAGIYFNCGDFGLDTLAGCTIKLKVYADQSDANTLSVYTDGDIFISQNIAITANPHWADLTLEVSEDINNTMFGVLIQSSTGVSGTVCNIDELSIYNKNDALIENIGDYQVIEKGKSKGNSPLMIVIFVVLIVAVLLVCAYFIIKFVILRYR